LCDRRFIFRHKCSQQNTITAGYNTHEISLVYVTQFLAIKYLKYVCIRLEVLQILVYGSETLSLSCKQENYLQVPKMKSDYQSIRQQDLRNNLENDA